MASKRGVGKMAGAAAEGLMKPLRKIVKQGDELGDARPTRAAPTGRTDLPENPRIRSSGSRDVGNPGKADVDAYNRIRANQHDTPQIAANTGIPQNVIDRAKKNLFLDTHRVETGPHTSEVGRFTPDKDTADLWNKAEKGTLSPEEASRFKRLMSHEYIESKLMERGMPYRSDHPDYWNHPDLGPGVNNPTAQHHGAHDLSPREDHTKPPFSHYDRTVGQGQPSIDIAHDLSNLDDVVDMIWRGAKR